MSSEKTASAVNVLKGDLAAGWNLLEGSSADYTDLGVARRFGGAAAAYSLRDIGAMNGRVVNVRREPHDTSAGIDDEINFSANQVSSGALEDWVNGKLESTLPADVATAAAAYSLRKVKASYSGDAVRIRRSSDDIEVDVAFDSDDKVSASSAITNLSEEGGEIGSTTATTVAEFLSEERTTFITNPVMTTVSGDITVLSNTTSSTEFTFTFSGSTGDGFVRHNGKPDNLGADIGDTVSFDITASGLSQQCGVRARRTGANNDAISPGINNIDNGTQTITFTVTSNGPVGYFAFVNLGSASTGTIRVHNLKVVGKSAFVHTWYDQAGSNNAVQDTDANQPKIAESGALLADGLDFDGSNDFLQTSTQVLTGTETGANSMYAVVKQTSGDAGYICGSAANPSGDQIGQSLYGASNDKIILTNGNDATATGSLDAITRIEGSNYLISSNYSNNNTNTLHSNANANGYANGSSAYDFNAGDRFTIAARKDSTSAAAVLFTGSMKEIIAYDSDQSANRFKIESNINNYYGLYNDANEFNTSTWQNGGTGSLASWDSLTNSSKDGFVASTNNSSGSTENAVCSLNFTNVVPNNGRVFVSFNCEFGGTAVTAASKRLRVQLRDSSGNIANDIVQPVDGGDGATAFRICNQGFNTVAFTVNSNTASNIEFLLEVANGRTGSATVTDLKVSRIARNGFVETWYDQSGNGNNATQASANSQPKIVTNGGIMTLENGTPSLGFNRSGGLSHFTLDSGISNEPYTFFATTVHNGLHYFRIFAEGNNPPSIILNSGSGGSIVYYPSDSDSSGTLSTTAIFSDNIVSGFSGVNGGADGIVRINGTNLKTDISRTQAADSITQIGRFPNTSAEFSNIESLVIYESDLSADFDTIEKELAQPINIL